LNIGRHIASNRVYIFSIVLSRPATTSPASKASARKFAIFFQPIRLPAHSAKVERRGPQGIGPKTPLDELEFEGASASRG